MSAALSAHQEISIHAPCTGSDLRPPSGLHRHKEFQSTLPARGATTIQSAVIRGQSISIHAPCTGSDPPDSCDPVRAFFISIHAPCTGSDDRKTRQMYKQWDFNPRSLHGERRCWHILSEKFIVFQSTLPARGATYAFKPSRFPENISIHAPCTGSDSDAASVAVE